MVDESKEPEETVYQLRERIVDRMWHMSSLSIARRLVRFEALVGQAVKANYALDNVGGDGDWGKLVSISCTAWAKQRGLLAKLGSVMLDDKPDDVTSGAE